MAQPTSGSTHVRGALYTVLVGVIWVVLAIRSPAVHYHFAPLFAAAAWPLSLRSQGQRTGRDALIAASGSAGLTLVITLGLQLAGKLDGPNFAHRGPAWPEAVLFAVLGAAIAARVASRERPGLLGGLIEGPAES